MPWRGDRRAVESPEASEPAVVLVTGVGAIIGYGV